MASYGYSFVTDKAFSAFARDLEQGAWKSVSIDKYDVPNRVPAALRLDSSSAKQGFRRGFRRSTPANIFRSLSGKNTQSPRSGLLSRGV